MSGFNTMGGDHRQVFGEPQSSFYDTLERDHSAHKPPRAGQSMRPIPEEENRNSMNRPHTAKKPRPPPDTHPFAGQPPAPDGWPSVEWGQRDPNNKFDAPPKANGAVYIKNLKNDLLEAMRMKQGVASETPPGVLDFWKAHIMKKDSHDPYADLKKSTYKKPKPRPGEKPTTEKSRLEIYTELEKLYGELRPMDVRYTLEHDFWKLQIDKATEDERRVGEFDQREKRRQQLAMKEKINGEFRRHYNCELKIKLDHLKE
jgi:hypothetical protein